MDKLKTNDCDILVKALNTVSNAVFICDANGIIIWVNESFERISGYSTDEVVNITTPRIFKSGRHSIYHYKNLWDTIKAGKVWQGEVVNRKKNGKIFHAYQTITPVTDNSDKVTYFIAVHDDITDFNSVKYALDEKTKQLMYSQKVAKIGYWHWDVETNQIEWSNNMYELFGVDDTSFVPNMQNILERIDKNDVKNVIHSMNKAVSEKAEEFSIDYKIYVGMETKYLYSKAKVEFNEEGTPTGLFGISQDVTERKYNELKLEKQTLRLRNASRISQIGYWEWNLIDNEAMWSLELYNLLNLDKSIKPSKDLLLSFVHFDDKDRLVKTIHKAIKENKRYSITYKIMLNKEIRHFHEIGESIYKNDNPTYVISTVRDITDEYNADLKLKNQLMLTSGILEAIPNSVVYKSVNGDILGCNKAFEDLVSIPEEEILGKRLEELFDNEEVKKFHYMDSKIFNGDLEYKRVEMVLQDKYFVIYSSVFTDNENNPIGIIKVFIDISDRKTNEDQIKWVASHDVLTGLSNRSALNEKLTLELSDTTTNVAILLLDLDHFKDVNDTLGHDFGDMLLVEVAYRIRQAVRKNDFIARLGGDEFAIILSNIPDQSVAINVSKKIISSISEPFNIKNSIVHIGSSIGITISPDHGTNFQELMKQADLSLYKAKEDGRGKYVLYESDLNEVLQRRKYVEEHIRYALENEGLMVYYQPRMYIDPNDKLVVSGVEALLRLSKDKLHDICIQEFIDVAELSGLINNVDEWITKQALSDCKIIQDIKSDLLMSINISPTHFKNACFSTTLKQIVSKSEISLSSLEFEITENVLMTESERNLSQLQDLSEFGIKFALDDFGTGYSSLSYISRFPVETLKIDKSFVSGIGYDKEKEAIIKAVIGLCNNLEVKVLAEGVETKEQADFLIKSGCRYHQGYLYHKAIPIEKLLEIIKE